MTLQLGPIAQISRTVKDIKQAEVWYGGVLGLRHLFSFGPLAFFDCGGVRLYLNQADAPPAESIIYFKVDDMQQAHAKLVAKGVEFITPPRAIHKHSDGTEEWLAVFNDPEGRPLALMSQIKVRDP